MSSASSFAKRQLEKYGWKEGEGLGRNKDGLSNYIKTSRHGRSTHNKDEKGASFAGIGHESTKGGGDSSAEKAAELDLVFAEMRAQQKKKRRDRVSSDDDDDDTQKQQEPAPEKPENSADRAKKPKHAEHEKGAEEEEEAKAEKPTKQNKKKPQAPSSSSSSSSSSDDDDDVGTMSDAKMFARCGGVRLGRAGRHRFFDNKLKRIEEHNATTSSKDDPYKAAALKNK